MSTYERICSLLEQSMIVGTENMNPSTTIDDLGMDSLDYVEMIMSMEEEFDVEISDEDAEKIKTIQDAVDLVETLI